MNLSPADDEISVAAFTRHSYVVLLEEGVEAGPGKPGDSASGPNIPISGRNQFVQIL